MAAIDGARSRDMGDPEPAKRNGDAGETGSFAAVGIHAARQIDGDRQIGAGLHRVEQQTQLIRRRTNAARAEQPVDEDRTRGRP